MSTVARPEPERRRLHGLAPLFAAILLACAPLVACEGLDVPGLSSSPERAAIDRETFVSTYVDLRLAALRSPAGTISDERRAEVLRRHGVERDDLLRFVEVHGDRPEFMRGVWAEAEERIERAREAGDTASGCSPSDTAVGGPRTAPTSPPAARSRC